MEKQMVQCEDGRRRQARIHGVPREKGDFRIWKAGVRFQGKHIAGEAWYSHHTKTWYFLTDPEGKHGHLMNRLNQTRRQESINQLEERLKVLESRHGIEQKKILEHRTARAAIETEINEIKAQINDLRSGAPLETKTPLAHSPYVKRY
jgi:hypothetical protein